MRQDLSIMLPEWRLAAAFVAPNRLRENLSNKAPGRRNDHRIIDNQAGRSLRTFVSGMMNGATPRARPWFNLTTNDIAKANTSSARKYFSKVEGIINNHFQVSNLYRVLPLAYKDVGVFSNSAFAMLPHVRYGFWFYPFAIGTYAFACDAEGNTNTFTRDFSLSVKQVVDQYAHLTKTGHIDYANIPNWIEDHYKASRFLEVVVLTTVIIPNGNYNPIKLSLNAYDKKFISYTYIQSGGAGLPPQSSSGFRNENSSGKSEFIKCSGFDYFPIITPRWEVQAEENYGVDGPTQIALSDIMAFQEMEKARLVGVDKLLRPPMVGHASLRRHQASILAGGITYVDDQGALAGFKPAFEVDPRMSELLLTQDKYSNSIRQSYFEDLFLMLSSEKTVSHVSAREIDEKASEKMTALAPALGQLDQDLNSKIIENAQIILEVAKRMPAKPKELEGEQLRPEYISIIAQAAKVSMMNSMERALNFASSVSQMNQDPSLLKLINSEMAIRQYMDYVALDPILIRDEDEFEEIQKEISAQNQQQLEAQQDMQQASAAKDLSAAKVGQGSLLDTLLTASEV